jgi:hypothetical protein
MSNEMNALLELPERLELWPNVNEVICLKKPWLNLFVEIQPGLLLL